MITLGVYWAADGVSIWGTLLILRKILRVLTSRQTESPVEGVLEL
jgi:hypothetical protein